VSGAMASNNQVCQLCETGKASMTLGANSSSACHNCPIGTYAPQEGMAQCTVCGSNSYQDESGNNHCKLCPGSSKILDNGIDVAFHDQAEDCVVSGGHGTTTMAPGGNSQDGSGSNGGQDASSSDDGDGTGSGTSNGGTPGSWLQFDGPLFAGVVAFIVTVFVVVGFVLWRRRKRGVGFSSHRESKMRPTNPSFEDTIHLQFSDNEADVDDFEMATVATSYRDEDED
jgi:hypothetical protein